MQYRDQHAPAVFLSYATGRTAARHFIEEILTPSLGADGIDVVSEQEGGLSVRAARLRAISRADVVIAEVSQSTPSVLYEVGVASGLGKPVILVAESSQNLPTDVADFTVVLRSGLVDPMVSADRVRRHVHAVRSTRPTLTEYIIAPPAEHVIVEARVNTSRVVEFTADVARLFEQLEPGTLVGLDRVRPGSLVAWIRGGKIAAKVGRRVLDTASDRDRRSAEAGKFRGEEDKLHAEADEFRRRTDRDDMLAEIEVAERLVQLVKDLGVDGPIAVTVGGKARIEKDAEGQIRIQAPTPRQLGRPEEDDPESPA